MKYVCSPEAAACDCQVSSTELTMFLAKEKRMGAGNLRRSGPDLFPVDRQGSMMAKFRW